MSKQGLFWVAVTTALWIVVGGLGTYLWLNREPAAPDPGAAIRESLSVLNLNAEQKRQIDLIIRDYQELAVQADREFWSTVNAAERAADAEIEAVLTEEQKRRYFAAVVNREE